MDKNRKTAYEVLLDVEKNSSYSNLAINNFISKNKPDNPAFVREMVYGVLENKIYIDYILNKLIPSGLKKVKKQDLCLLRMGIYQLKFMDSVPDYAAVNESVNMAKVFCRGRDRFINGVLRGFLKCDKSVDLPDYDKNPVEHICIKHSMPEWIVTLWADGYGMEKAEEITAASNETPPLCLRVNVMKNSAEELIDKLEQEGFTVAKGQMSERAVLVKGKGTGILESKLFRDGCFSVQDEASILTTDILNPQPGDTVVDVCAAPGGKTLAMAEKMQSKGCINAFDKYEHKLELIDKQAERLGIDIIKTKCHDSTELFAELTGSADCVLADVPCSGLGVIRRKPEIKYKEDLDLDELIERQRMILNAASAYVKDGGRLVYSTCTINPDENERQVNNFLKVNADFKLETMKQFFPGNETDGFFICSMIKNV